MNEGDYGNQAADLFQEVALLNAKKKDTWLHYVGRCHNCDDPLEEGLFCDGACADDYEKRKRFKA